MRNKNSLLFLLGGLAIGALIGIFLAPDKGSETRKKAADKGKRFLDNIQEKFNNTKENSTNDINPN